MNNSIDFLSLHQRRVNSIPVFFTFFFVWTQIEVFICFWSKEVIFLTKIICFSFSCGPPKFENHRPNGNGSSAGSLRNRMSTDSGLNGNGNNKNENGNVNKNGNANKNGLRSIFFITSSSSSSKNSANNDDDDVESNHQTKL